MLPTGNMSAPCTRTKYTFIYCVCIYIYKYIISLSIERDTHTHMTWGLLSAPQPHVERAPHLFTGPATRRVASGPQAKAPERD